MNIFTKTAGALLWSRATYFYYRKDFLKSLHWYMKFKKLNQENKKTVALYATLLALIKNDSKITKNEFERSLGEKSLKSIEESIYIDLYCKLYIEIIESGSDNENIQACLKAQNVNDRLRRLLPAPIVS